MSDWKEINNVDKPCSETNGWCGWCGNCQRHAEEIQERDYTTHWGDDE